MNADRVIVSGLVLALFAGASVTAGPLTPPAGPVASTGKSLSEIEPRTVIPVPTSYPVVISAPGSYVLAGPLTPPSGTSAIQFTQASGRASLDLNGFTVTGGGSATVIDSTGKNLSIRNGTVVGGAIGIKGGSVVAADLILELQTLHGLDVDRQSSVRNVTIISSGTTGIRGTRDVVVENCTVNSAGTLTAGGGIVLGDNAIVRDSRVDNCKNVGIDVGAGSTIVACSVANTTGTDANGSTASGIGIRVGARSTITNSAATVNTLWGFALGTGSTITNSAAGQNNLSNDLSTGRNNPGGGFLVGTACIVQNCTADTNGGFGFRADAGAIITASTASNTRAVAGSLGVGYEFSTGGSLISSASRANTSHGVLLNGSNNTVSGGTFTGHSGASIAGVAVNGSFNRVTGVQSVNNNVGIIIFTTSATLPSGLQITGNMVGNTGTGIGVSGSFALNATNFVPGPVSPGTLTSGSGPWINIGN